MSVASMLNILEGGGYRIVKRICVTPNSVVYVGIELSTGEDVAIKVSELGCSSDLITEKRFYEDMGSNIIRGIPTMHYFTIETDYCYMVLDLLGPSLEDMFSICDRNFSLKTVLMLMDQMIHRVEDLHSKCYVHRDINPGNFVLGLANHSNLVHLIDFGAAKRYRSSGTSMHAARTDEYVCTSTREFSSMSHHQGYSPFRRDDLESLGYIMIYLLEGTLPWMHVTGQTGKERADKVAELKMSTTAYDLCKDYPYPLMNYFNYLSILDHCEKPNYEYLREQMMIPLAMLKLKNDNLYDWTSHDMIMKKYNRYRTIMTKNRKNGTSKPETHWTWNYIGNVGDASVTFGVNIEWDPELYNCNKNYLLPISGSKSISDMNSIDNLIHEEMVMAAAADAFHAALAKLNRQKKAEKKVVIKGILGDTNFLKDAGLIATSSTLKNDKSKTVTKHKKIKKILKRRTSVEKKCHKHGNTKKQNNSNGAIIDVENATTSKVSIAMSSMYINASPSLFFPRTNLSQGNQVDSDTENDPFLYR